MKKILFILNTVLAIALFGFTVFNVMEKKKDVQTYSVKRTEKKSTAAKSAVKAVKKQQKESPETLIVKNNLFNQARNPGSQTNTGRNQIQMTLVGVSMVGDWKGAIILQRNNTRRRFGPPMPNNRFQNQQNQQNQTYQQYVRVGEKLENGYVLTEVSRTGATLTMNGNKLELKLQEASKGQTTTRTAAPRRNTTTTMLQQMQNMQRMQMMQQWQMMRMMRNQNGQQFNNQQRQPTGNRGGARRR